MSKYLRHWSYYAYRVYAELASRYYAFKDRNNPIPPLVCHTCGKPGHFERLCPNAWRMGYLDRMKKGENCNKNIF